MPELPDITVYIEALAARITGARLERVRLSSPFVLRFLGAVNVFHGRVEGGRARVGGLDFPAPAAEGAEKASVYVRHHELELFTVPSPESFAARVLRVTPVGASVRVELAVAAFDRPLSAELDPQRYQALGVRAGDRVFAAPRRVRVFAGDQPGESLTASGL